MTTIVRWRAPALGVSVTTVMVGDVLVGDVGVSVDPVLVTSGSVGTAGVGTGLADTEEEGDIGAGDIVVWGVPAAVEETSGPGPVQAANPGSSASIAATVKLFIKPPP